MTVIFGQFKSQKLAILAMQNVRDSTVTVSVQRKANVFQSPAPAVSTNEC